MNLFEIMQKAGGGDLFSSLAPAYGLSESQFADAVAAFLPAFSLSLKRSTSDPFGLADLMQRLAAGDYLKAYQNPDWARGAGRSAGQEAVSFLFGSPETVAALARQASAATGLTADKLTEMLPALASVLLGGLAAQSAASNPMAEAMRNLFPTGPKASGMARGPLDRLEEEQAEKDRTKAADLIRQQGEMMQAGMAAWQSQAAAWQDAVTATINPSRSAGAANAPDAPTSGAALFGDLLEPGKRLGEAYREQMEAAFNRLKRDDAGR